MVDVMLAVTRKGSPAEIIEEMMSSDQWWFEVKMDGIRAVLTITTAGVSILNRRGRDITFRYPEVVAAWAGHSPGTLDGEIICYGQNGMPDFSRIHRRDAQQTASRARRVAALYPATFVPFDVLDVAGVSMRDLPYAERHQLLGGATGGHQVSAAYTDGRFMWDFVLRHELEGLIAKRADSRYTPGRHASWVKLKATKRLNVLVGGYTSGNGSRGTVGALEIYLWDPDTEALVSVGRVGSGLSAGNTRAILADLGEGRPVVVEVEYLEMSANRHLRMPVFKGIRRDVSPESCVTNTLK